MGSCLFGRVLDGHCAQAQAQVVELAQLGERLVTAEQTNRANTEKLTAELASAHESTERLRVELASIKATTESDLRHAREEARNHQLATEQINGLLEHVRNELAQARNQTSEVREEAARLRGQVEAIESQRAELVKVLSGRSAT